MEILEIIPIEIEENEIDDSGLDEGKTAHIWLVNNKGNPYYLCGAPLSCKCNCKTTIIFKKGSKFCQCGMRYCEYCLFQIGEFNESN